MLAMGVYIVPTELSCRTKRFGVSKLHVGTTSGGGQVSSRRMQVQTQNSDTRSPLCVTTGIVRSGLWRGRSRGCCPCGRQRR